MDGLERLHRAANALAGTHSEAPVSEMKAATADRKLSKVRKPYTITKQRERWTDHEHELFVEALELHGRTWKRIEDHIGTKTAVQIRSHAQKFFSKLEKEQAAGAKGLADLNIPPPRPKRKPSHPYPRKVSGRTESLPQPSQLAEQSAATLTMRLRTSGDHNNLQAAQQLQRAGSPEPSGMQLQGTAQERKQGEEAAEATVAAVATAASVAAAAAAAAVIAAAGQQVQAQLQARPPQGFPFFGLPPSALAQIARSCSALRLPAQSVTLQQAHHQELQTASNARRAECTATNEPLRGLRSAPAGLVLGSDGDSVSSEQRPAAAAGSDMAAAVLHGLPPALHASLGPIPALSTGSQVSGWSPQQTFAQPGVQGLRAAHPAASQTMGPNLKMLQLSGPGGRALPVPAAAHQTQQSQSSSTWLDGAAVAKDAALWRLGAAGPPVAASQLSPIAGLVGMPNLNTATLAAAALAADLTQQQMKQLTQLERLAAHRRTDLTNNSGQQQRRRSEDSDTHKPLAGTALSGKVSPDQQLVSMLQPVQAVAGAGAGAGKHVLRPSVVRAQPSTERKGPEHRAGGAEGVRSGSGSGSNVPGGPPSADGNESSGEGTKTNAWSNVGSNGSGSVRGSAHLQGPCDTRAPAEEARDAGGKEQSGIPVPLPEGRPVPPTEGAVAALNRSNCGESGDTAGSRDGSAHGSRNASLSSHPTDGSSRDHSAATTPAGAATGQAEPPRQDPGAQVRLQEALQVAAATALQQAGINPFMLQQACNPQLAQHLQHQALMQWGERAGPLEMQTVLASLLGLPRQAADMLQHQAPAAVQKPHLLKMAGSSADRQWSGLSNSQPMPNIAKAFVHTTSPAPAAPSPFASQQAQERAYSDTLASVGGLPGALRAAGRKSGFLPYKSELVGTTSSAAAFTQMRSDAFTLDTSLGHPSMSAKRPPAEDAAIFKAAPQSKRPCCGAEQAQG